MKPDDVLITLALIFLVVRQVRPRLLTVWGLLWPVPLVLYAAWQNLHAVPRGADLRFTVLLVLLGVGLGLGCGLTTQVYRREAGIMAHATGLAVVLWLLGMGARLGFAVAATHGAGPAIARFSAAYQLSETAWVAGLVSMSLAEVIGRSATLLWRRRLVSVSASVPAASQPRGSGV